MYKQSGWDDLTRASDRLNTALTITEAAQASTDGAKAMLDALCDTRRFQSALKRQVRIALVEAENTARDDASTKYEDKKKVAEAARDDEDKQTQAKAALVNYKVAEDALRVAQTNRDAAIGEIDRIVSAFVFGTC